MKFSVRLTLISEVVTEDRACFWHSSDETCNLCPNDENESIPDHIYKDYYATDGSAVMLKEDNDLDFASTPFSATELIDSSELPLFQRDWFILVDQNESEVTFQLQPQAEVIVESATEQEAREVCQKLLPQLFEIYNLASLASDGLEIKTVEIDIVKEI
jgi:hypothetical protein